MSLKPTEDWWRCYSPPEMLSQHVPVFLDRDGVINTDTGYVHKPGDVQLVPGAASAIAQMNAAGHPVIVVTNQSGVGRGYYDWTAFHTCQDHIQSLLKQEGAHMDAVFASPCHPDAQPPYDVADHPWRKPNPGMILAAQSIYGLAIDQAWLVGDNLTDLHAAEAAGCFGGVLVGEKNLDPYAFTTHFRAEASASLASCVETILLASRM